MICSTRSPAAWPNVSLTVLKSSRSRNSTASGRLSVASAAERVFDAITEQRPVREVGDRVVEGLIGELLLELLALGDVAQVDDDAADRGVVQQVGDQTLGVQQAAIAVANAKLERLRGLRRAREQHRRAPARTASGPVRRRSRGALGR